MEAEVAVALEAEADGTHAAVPVRVAQKVAVVAVEVDVGAVADAGVACARCQISEGLGRWGFTLPVPGSMVPCILNMMTRTCSPSWGPRLSQRALASDSVGFIWRSARLGCRSVSM